MVHVDSVRWGAFDDWATVLLVLLLGLALVEGWCGAGVAGELAVSGHLLELGRDGAGVGDAGHVHGAGTGTGCIGSSCAVCDRGAGSGAEVLGAWSWGAVRAVLGGNGQGCGLLGSLAGCAEGLGVDGCALPVRLEVGADFADCAVRADDLGVGDGGLGAPAVLVGLPVPAGLPSNLAHRSDSLGAVSLGAVYGHSGGAGGSGAGVSCASLVGSLDPALHLAAGRALAPLRDEGVVIVGSGMSFHNLRGYFRTETQDRARAFDQWLTEAVEKPAPERDALLTAWREAPFAAYAHPREEHLIPLMVAAGAGGAAAGTRIFSDEPMGAAISAYRFDG